MRSNCILFAFALWWRRGRRGYVSVRISHHVHFFHFLYGQMRESGHVRLVSYVPINPKKQLLPPPLFRGRVQWGDNERPPSMNTDEPLSPDELKALRQLLQDAEHATWLRKKIFIVAPIVFVVVSGFVSAVNWIVSHLTFKP